MFARRTLFSLVILLVFLTTSCRSASPAPKVTRVASDLQITRLAPGVWMHTSWKTLADGTPFPSNGLVVREGDHLILVDTAWGEVPTRELLDWIDNTLRLPIAAAIITHFHDDRIGGAALLERRRIPFWASPMTVEIARRENLPVPSELGRLAAAGSAQKLGNVEVFYPGPAHSADNVVVWIARDRVLFGGCAIRAASTKDLGNVADADVAHWATSVGRVLERYQSAEVVVPGHGDPGDVSLLRHTIEIASGEK